MTHRINFKEIPKPKEVIRYECPSCGCHLHTFQTYEEHYKEHQKSGFPFHIAMSLPPYED